MPAFWPDPVARQSGKIRGGRVLCQKRPAGANSYKLYVRQALGDEERLLVDPTIVTIDGKHVSYGQSAAGSELATTHVLEVESGKLLPERIERTPFIPATWLPDASGFFYTRLAESARSGSVDFFRDMVACLHRLGTDSKTDATVLTRVLHPAVAMEPFEMPILLTDPTSAHVVAIVAGGVRRENPVYTARVADVLAGRPDWRKGCEVADEVVGIAFRGDDLYVLSTKDAPNARVLRTSLAQPSFRNAAVVVPEGTPVVEGIAAARDGLYLQDMEGGYHSVRRLGADGKLTPAPLPFEGAILGAYTNSTEDGAWIVATSWLEPYTVLRYDPAPGRAIDTGLSPRPPPWVPQAGLRRQSLEAHFQLRELRPDVIDAPLALPQDLVVRPVPLEIAEPGQLRYEDRGQLAATHRTLEGVHGLFLQALVRREAGMAHPAPISVAPQRAAAADRPALVAQPRKEFCSEPIRFGLAAGRAVDAQLRGFHQPVRGVAAEHRGNPLVRNGLRQPE